MSIQKIYFKTPQTLRQVPGALFCPQIDVYHSWELVCVHLNLVQSILKQLVITLKIRFVTLTYSSVCRCLQIYIQAAVRRVAANCIFCESDGWKGVWNPLPWKQVKLYPQWRAGSVVRSTGKAGVESAFQASSIWLPPETLSWAPPSQFWAWGLLTLCLCMWSSQSHFAAILREMLLVVTPYFSGAASLWGRVGRWQGRHCHHSHPS